MKRKDSANQLSGDDNTTTIKAYDKEDTYNEMASGHSSIDKFATLHEQCSVCNLVATNKQELEDHMRHAHSRQMSTGEELETKQRASDKGKQIGENYEMPSEGKVKEELKEGVE